MPDKITFFAIIGGSNTLDNPRGLARRLEFDGDGFTDEALRDDFQLEVHAGDCRVGTRRLR